MSVSGGFIWKDCADVVIRQLTADLVVVLFWNRSPFRKSCIWEGSKK